MGYERLRGNSFERKRDPVKEKEWQKEQEKIKKKGLEKIKKIERLLLHPEIPHAKRGIEGMCSAQEILKKQNSVGLLIGGLSHTIYNKEATVNDLASHKDVDVMVLNDSFSIPEKFYGGIDWWLPQKNGAAYYSYIQRWGTVWENGHNIKLFFTLERISGYSDKYEGESSYCEFEGLKAGDNVNEVFENSEDVQEFFSDNQVDILPSGLYIPTRKWLIEKSTYEFRQMYRKKYKTDPSYFESNSHEEGIISTLHESAIESLPKSFSNSILKEDQHSHAPYIFDNLMYSDIEVSTNEL